MHPSDPIYTHMIDILRSRLGETLSDFLLPPPVFTLMQGQFIDLDMEAGCLSARFPILESYFNPYHAVQGGILAAAVDNTLGPLSMLLAPPNVTRTLEMKYSRPVTLDMGFITVHARLVSRHDPRLFFEARASSPDGSKLATCKALHWIIAPSSQ
jgi:acyl-coenzyme A thioesterase PaaI-like protein